MNQWVLFLLTRLMLTIRFLKGCLDKSLASYSLCFIFLVVNSNLKYNHNKNSGTEGVTLNSSSLAIYLVPCKIEPFHCPHDNSKSNEIIALCPWCHPFRVCDYACIHSSKPSTGSGKKFHWLVHPWKERRIGLRPGGVSRLTRTLNRKLAHAWGS
jgi:hypothetical protein